MSTYGQDEAIKKISDSEIDEKDFVVIKDDRLFKQDKSMVPYP